MAKRLPPDIRDYFVKMGKKGGKLGGVARAAKMTDQQRSESARRAVKARWAKARGESRAHLAEKQVTHDD